MMTTHTKDVIPVAHGLEERDCSARTPDALRDVGIALAGETR